MSELGWLLIGGGIVMLAASVFAWALCRAAAIGDRQEVEQPTYHTTHGRNLTVDVTIRRRGATARVRQRGH